MSDKPLAAIDIGTNTFRLLIAYVYANPDKRTYSIKEVASERIITRLGAGLSSKGLLKREAITKSLKALCRFSEILSLYEVLKVSAVATSALREAQNSDDFLMRAKDAAGLRIKIISGEEEARKTASGILIDIKIPDTALMVDIGGGSTELIFSRHGKPLLVRSLRLGVVYLAGKFMRHDPPLKEDLIKMERYISREIREILKPYLKLITRNSILGSETVLIGTAGTLTTLAALVKKLRKFEHKKIHGTKITRRKAENIFSIISTVSTDERAKLIPFEPSRLDIIVPGTLILLKLMELLNFKEITVSNYGLREGILVELYKKMNC